MFLRPACLLPLALSASVLPSLAAEPLPLGAPDCRIAALEPAPILGRVDWTGPCVDGYASGKGVLGWRARKLEKHSIEATLVRGEIQGEAVLRTPAYTYTGSLKNGVPHGQGFFEYADNKGWYEGEVVAGRRHGKGEKLDIDRARYVGAWANDERNGYGEASFASGGSYRGHWKNDAFEGHGSIVYAGAGHRYEGLFKDGRVAGSGKPEVDKGHYAIKAPESGSRLGKDVVVAPLPLKAGWETLTEAQRNVVRSQYPALEAGDDPPYPLKGQGPLFEMVRELNNRLGGASGLLAVYALIGKDGKPVKVTAYGAPVPGLAQAVQTAFLIQQFKPATCRGEPCEMVYPIHFQFSLED